MELGNKMDVWGSVNDIGFEWIGDNRCGRRGESNWCRFVYMDRVGYGVRIMERGGVLGWWSGKEEIVG